MTRLIMTYSVLVASAILLAVVIFQPWNSDLSGQSSSMASFGPEGHQSARSTPPEEWLSEKIAVRPTEVAATPAPASSDPRLAGMVWIPGGRFTMGNAMTMPDEGPPHTVELDGYWMDRTEITNRQFREFVQATGYVTLPERKPELRSIRPGSDLADIQILEELNVPGSICSLPLSSLAEIDPQKGAYSWWQYVAGASWQHPDGPESGIDDKLDHPVVHVSWPDAVEYCRWAGKALPTEAQWEFAARGGHTGDEFPWGPDRNPDDQWLHNIWQGQFPVDNTAADGHLHTAPVGSYPPNDFGLYDVSGNVWEWCADYYQPDYYRRSPLRNPAGPEDSLDPLEPDIVKRVQRGGSFMCSEQYCLGYRVSARMKGEEDTGAFHTGFRCIVTPEMLATPAPRDQSSAAVPGSADADARPAAASAGVPSPAGNL